MIARLILLAYLTGGIAASVIILCGVAFVVTKYKEIHIVFKEDEDD